MHVPSGEWFRVMTVLSWGFATNIICGSFDVFVVIEGAARTRAGLACATQSPLCTTIHAPSEKWSGAMTFWFRIFVEIVLCGSFDVFVEIDGAARIGAGLACATQSPLYTTIHAPSEDWSGAMDFWSRVSVETIICGSFDVFFVEIDGAARTRVGGAYAVQRPLFNTIHVLDFSGDADAPA